MSSSMAGLSPLERLKGRENFQTWKIGMRAVLEHEGLWNCVLGIETAITDVSKMTRAKAKITLSLEPINYIHVQNASTPKEAWDKLEEAFEDSGLTRKVTLIRKLTTTQLKDCTSVDEYVNTIISTAHQLNGVKLEVPDEWIGTLLLAGLPDEYKPMIMGLENSGLKITADSIKMKILQEVKVSGAEPQAAFYSKKKMQKGPRCYSCNGIGHIASNCKSKPKKQNYQRPTESSNSYKKNKERTERTFCMFKEKPSTEDTWYVDSCASVHVVSATEKFMKTSEENICITTANNGQMSAKSTGTVKINVKLADGTHEIEAKDVVYVPESQVNLLSISKIVSKGNSVLFSPKENKIVDKNGDLMAKMTEENGIYKLQTQESQKVYATMKITSAELWHKRLGHLNRKGMSLLNQGMVTGMKYKKEMENKPCEACIKGKMNRQPFKAQGKRTSEILQLVHSDVCGPMENQSIGGSKYFVTFIDDYTRKVFVYFMKNKNEVLSIFKDFKAEVENETDRRIKILRTDNGTEYVNGAMKSCLAKSGIKHQLTIPYSPQQNGLAERLNRTIVEKARSMLEEANLPKKFWAEAVSTAAYLINRSPTKELPKMTPEEAWTGNKPNLEHLRIFGCKAMAHIPKEKRQKWDPKANEHIFIGYCEDSKGYRLLEQNTMSVVRSRDVIFYENGKSENMQASTKRATDVIKINDQEIIDGEESEMDGEDLNDDEKTELEDTSSVENEEDQLDIDFVQPHPVHQTDEVRRSSRARKATDMKDYVTYFAHQTEQHGFATVTEMAEDPLTVAEALSRSDRKLWLKAIEDERTSLVENNTWKLCTLPPGKKALDTKWVFKTKRGETGEILRHKARLVARGCRQIEGIDYNETFSPVIRHASIRFLCALAAKYDLKMSQMDVVTAYLQGELEEEIYIWPPEELLNPGEEGKVWKLKKAIYGLKQSGRSWNQKLNRELKDLGFAVSKADPCVYHKFQERKMLIIGVYVDDLFILSNDDRMLQKTKDSLAGTFKVKDLGEARYLLGLRINQNRQQGEVSLDQENYIRDVLDRFNMAESKQVATPMDPNQKLEKDQCPKNEAEREEMLKIPYKEAIGSLLYISQCTRPDIAYAVNKVSRFSNNPGKPHWMAVKRIFRYLKGTSTKKLTYQRNKNTAIEGYGDADWANDSEDRRSITGSVLKLQGGAVSWQSKKQTTVALSTTEAEYMAMSTTCQEMLWLRSLAMDLDPKYQETEPIILYCDNMGAVELTKTTNHRARSKHIDVRHHFVRERVERKEVSIRYIPTEEMTADALTKPLFLPALERCCENMGLK